ncbi:hypothetical protein TSH58p_17695 [Azospirillum sp. TSH58]|uniref:hypothetical protein n=1 Tax=Azospirillum sp. TSH58 TaxID=664962 RepID=UPI000D6012CB|nr:hypothetical protein [Azospirillum sp. TSH58]AWJ85183.1 hypothetical protein TSH58p_17620 [Azospirillum sp. TSH58]AWJ85197.1 hypothetical protein TSH58p_17695 [Azospirillum sp. TSH58]PWC72057.1 hypothetical protein TSH58_09000 [Azospirillum sp. TSH58]
MNAQPSAEAGTLVWGLGNIAKHLGITKRQAHYQHEKGNLPTFKPPGTNKIAARRESLDELVKGWEAAGRTDGAGAEKDPGHE